MTAKVKNSKAIENCGSLTLTMAERFLILNARAKDQGYNGLGEMVDVHRVTVSGWVTGKRMPDAAACKKLLQFCRPLITAEDLAGSPSAGRGRPKKEKSVELDILKPMPRQKDKAPPAKSPAPAAEADEWDF